MFLAMLSKNAHQWSVYAPCLSASVKQHVSRNRTNQSNSGLQLSSPPRRRGVPPSSPSPRVYDSSLCGSLSLYIRKAHTFRLEMLLSEEKNDRLTVKPVHQHGKQQA